MTHAACTRILLVLLSLAATLVASAANVGPELTAPISALTIQAGAAAPSIALDDHFRDPDVPGSAVRIHVRLGTQTANLYLALFDEATPQTVANFKSYIANGAYNSNFFHRSVPGFIIQNGGYKFNGTELGLVPTLPPVPNEPGISNTRGTIAMAKVDGDPNSATSQWFINLADNSTNLDAQNGGFTVFGRVLGNGMTDIVDVLASVPTYNLAAFNLPWTEIPMSRDPFSDNMLYTSDFIETSAFLIAPLSHAAVADNPALVDVTIQSNSLQITAKTGVDGSTNVRITTTDLEGATLQTTIPVTVRSTNANLGNLALSAGALSPVFAAGTTAYTMAVANSVASTTVTPSASHGGASIQVNGTTVTSGAASAPIPLNVGPNTITIMVTAQDGTTNKTYTVTVTRAPSNVANLSSLTLSAGSLSPTFASGTTAYTVAVANSVTGTTVTPTVSHGAATVQVNGTTVTSGAVSSAIPLNLGPNTIIIEVTAQDESTKKSYTVTVTRAPSNVANLSNLALSAGSLSPAFASGTTAYTIAVANSVTGTTVTTTASHAAATVKVNGMTVPSGAASASIPLNVGANTITIQVTAQDGTTTRTYTVTITRARSNVANLRSLTLSAGSLSPTFASGTTTYTMVVANSVLATTVTPTVTDATAALKVNGFLVASASASASIPLVVGPNTITIEVTAQDDTTKKTYTVTVTRAPSNVASLSGLTVSAGSLSPAFASGTTAYTMAVANSVTSTTMTPTVSHAAATIQVNGTTVASGAASSAIPLNVGANTITIEATAQDGTTKRTYTVTITRAASSNAKLKSLVVRGLKLSPAFKAGRKTYAILADASRKTVQIQATVQDNTARVSVNGMRVKSGQFTKSLALKKSGKTVFKIVVTAQNKKTMTYTVTVNKP